MSYPQFLIDVLLCVLDLDYSRYLIYMESCSKSYCISLSSLNIIFSSFIHVVAGIRISFLVKME